MRVYQVNVVCGSGSTGKIAVDLAEAIQLQGGESRIAYGRGNASKEIDSFKISNKPDLYIHAMLTRITDKHGLYSRKATIRLIKDIEEYNPDIIHLHNIHGYYINYEILFRFLEKYGKPIVWTLHDCWPITGHCAHFDYVGCSRWQKSCYDCPQKKIYPASMLKDNSADNFERKKTAFNLPINMTIVTVSDWLYGIVGQSFLKNYPLKRIYNGIDLEVMHPIKSSLKTKYYLEDKKIVLGVASIWDERKGIDTFYELAKSISTDYQIVMIGLTKKQLQKKPKNILGIERINSQKELARWYAAADIYVNTSVEETMGMTTVEAMGCGTPVIVMNTTGSPELVDGKCGRSVEPGNIMQLLQTIKELENMKNKKEYCLECANNFEKSRQYAQYIELYKQLIEGKNG